MLIDSQGEFLRLLTLLRPQVLRYLSAWRTDGREMCTGASIFGTTEQEDRMRTMADTVSSGALNPNPSDLEDTLACCNTMHSHRV